MASTLTVPSHTFAVGPTVMVSPTAIASGLTNAVLDIDRTALNSTPAVTVLVSIDISYDNGATWHPITTSTIPGGITPDDDGNTVTRIHIETPFHQPALTTRRVRLTVNPSGGSFTSGGGTLVVS